MGLKIDKVENRILAYTPQPSQPLLRILNLSNTRVSVFPEVEEFLRIFTALLHHNKLLMCCLNI
jgi:hypothetical protein